jgi:pSer/pThr/pTyr-binding forkhead associated (FHA) protein
MSSFPYQLVMRAGPTPGKVYSLQKSELLIGRDPSNDIAIADAEVSRKHARLILQAGSFVLEDLGSTNGTFVNGQRLLGPHVLRAGEVILLGENVSLVFEAVYDENATLVAPVSSPPSYEQPYPPSPRPAPVYTMPEARDLAGDEYREEEQPKKKVNVWIFAGCGCLLIILCLLVGLIAFDALNMWCMGPFRVLSPLYQLISGGVCP